MIVIIAAGIEEKLADTTLKQSVDLLLDEEKHIDIPPTSLLEGDEEEVKKSKGNKNTSNKRNSKQTTKQTSNTISTNKS